jgi:hypothetical protein
MSIDLIIMSSYLCSALLRISPVELCWQIVWTRLAISSISGEVEAGGALILLLLVLLQHLLMMMLIGWLVNKCKCNVQQAGECSTTSIYRQHKD